MFKEFFLSCIEDVSQSLEMCFLIKILHYGSTCIELNFQLVLRGVVSVVNKAPTHLI